ncbi:MAG TPA: hypothetical protein DCY88_31165 [Cyanobacteria bacterium UBA11372]|nr:hypothetical protein [Cyanobacteria bacterium UBA11372]
MANRLLQNSCGVGILPAFEDKATKSVKLGQYLYLLQQLKMKDPKKQTLNIDAGTLVLIISALILLPLLFTGFFFQ